MTLEQIYKIAENYDIAVLFFVFSIPIIAIILTLISGRDKEKKSPWNYCFSVIIYLVTIPGMLQIIITGYLLFVMKTNLMTLNINLYLLPILSMVITLLIIAKNVDLRSIPGFDRLSGLLTMIGISLLCVFIISKTRIWLVFGGSIYLFFGLAIFFFALFKWGAYMLLRRSDEKEKSPPRFPY